MRQRKPRTRCEVEERVLSYLRQHYLAGGYDFITDGIPVSRLYPALARLGSQGRVQTTWVPSSHGGPARRMYFLPLK